MPRGEHLVLYDGVCGLCNRLVRFVLPRDTQGAFDFASLQSATGRSCLQRFGRNPDDLDTLCVVTDYRGGDPGLLTKSDAALFVGRRLAHPWPVLRAFGVLPRALRDRVYDRVARHRYRVFGRYDRCVVPDPAWRDRFLDV